MLDSLAEAIARVVGANLLHAIFYWPGWLLLRIVTLGKYPPERGKEHNEVLVSLFALGSLAAAITIYFSWKTSL